MISSLPEPIATHICTLLPIPDAARYSCVARAQRDAVKEVHGEALEWGAMFNTFHKIQDLIDRDNG